MRKTMNCVILTFFMLFVINLNIVKADPLDYSGSSEAIPGQYGKDGFWNTGAVAVKVSIINSNGEEEDTEIFFNSNYYKTTNYFSADNSSKLHQSSNIKWVRLSNYGYKYNSLPSNWKIDGKVFELADFLEKNNYYHLKTILNMTNSSGKIFDTFSSGDYVVIEPMAEMGNYYGTAYELTNSFYDYDNCSGEKGGTNNTFCWSYTGDVFGGNNSIFHNSIYLTSDVLSMSSSVKSCGDDAWNCYKDRSNSYKNKTYGRGIGVYEYSTLYPVIEYDLTIKKTDEVTGAGMYGVTFTLSGNGVTNSCTTDSAGNCTMYDVPESDTAYTLTETLKSGYSSSKTNCTGCESFSGTNFQVKVNGNKTIYITNGKTCDSEFAALSNKNDPIERIKLYQKYNYKNLLDFNNVTNPCVTSEDSCANNVQLGCLSAKSSISSFSATNLSCYKETIEIDGLIGYCGLDFSIYNKLSGSENIYKFENTFVFPTITSGQMFFKSNDNKIALGNIIKTCYLYDINNSGISGTPGNGSYDSYVDDLVFNGLELEQNIESTNWDKQTSGNLTTFTQVYSSQYFLPSAYAHKGNGGVVYTTPNDLTKYKFLGYGFASKLNNIEGYIDVPFSFKVKNKNLNNGVDGTLNAPTNTCKYAHNKEIVKNDKLDLEFRIIDTENPFPGKDGTSRNVGKNWCDNGNCSITKNNLIKTIIEDRIDSSYGCQAKYEITLSPSDIKAIRKYNKKTTYDDYNLTCDTNGENCESSFLNMLEDGTLDYKDEASVPLSNSLIRTEISSLKNKIENPSCQYANVPFEEEEPIEITLKGDNPLVLKNSSFYSQDPGYLLTGSIDNVTVDVVDYDLSDEPGEYSIYYLVLDEDGNEVTSAERTVIVPNQPMISLDYYYESYDETGFYFDTSNVNYEVYVDTEYMQEDDYEVTVCDEYGDCHDYGDDIYIETSAYLEYIVTDKFGYTNYERFEIEVYEYNYEDEWDEDEGTFGNYTCSSSDCYIEEEGFVECNVGNEGDFYEYNYKYVIDDGYVAFLVDDYLETSISDPNDICWYYGHDDGYSEEEYDELEEIYAYEAGYEDGYSDNGYNNWYSGIYYNAYDTGYTDGVSERERQDDPNELYSWDEGYSAGCYDGYWGNGGGCESSDYGDAYCDGYYTGYGDGEWGYCS